MLYVCNFFSSLLKVSIGLNRILSLSFEFRTKLSSKFTQTFDISGVFDINREAEWHGDFKCPKKLKQTNL